jgi:hypothetical protein
MMHRRSFFMKLMAARCAQRKGERTAVRRCAAADSLCGCTLSRVRSCADC